MIRIIARRLRKRTGTFVSFLPLASVVLFLFCVNVFIDSQSLTGEQEATAQLGDNAAGITLFDLTIPPGSDLPAKMRQSLASDHSVSVRLGMPDFPYYGADQDGAYYSEVDLAKDPQSSDVTLLSGSWPTRPGEVVVIGTDLDGVSSGDQIEIPGAAQKLTVVGLGSDKLVASATLLAAPGTWESLKVKDAALADLSAFPVLVRADGSPEDLAKATEQMLAQVAPDLLGPDKTDALSALSQRVYTRQEIALDVARPWSSQSPLSLWIPGLILLPMAMLFGYLFLGRQLVPAIRGMTRQGVSTRTAVTGAWLAAVPAVVVSTVLAASVGTLLGIVVSRFGQGRWGYLVYNWRFPLAAVIITATLVPASLLMAWFVLRSRASTARPKRRKHLSDGVISAIRHVVAGVLACAFLWISITLDSVADGMFLSGIASLLIALMAPEILGVLQRRLRQHTLKQRLVARQVGTNTSRISLSLAMYIAVISVTVGFATVLATHLNEMHERLPIYSPPGQLLVDNDGATFMAVAPAVTAALDTIPELQAQEPAQLFVLGQRVTDPEIGLELRHGVGTTDLPGLSFALQSVEDVERTYGRDLTPQEESTLTSGGVLVPNGDRVQITNGEILLVDNDSQKPLGTLPALAAEPEPSPWKDAVPAVMLRTTADAIGAESQPAAQIYTDIDTAAADAARDALVRAGFNPEMITIHQEPEPLAPPAALVGSALALAALILAVTSFSIRDQVRAMQGWARRLGHIGVSLNWAKSALMKQFLLVLSLAVPLGLGSGVLALAITKLQIPKLELVIPWTPIGLLLLTFALTTMVAAALAMRKLDDA